MPESMSLERRKLLKAFGAEIVLTPRADGMRGAVEAADRIAAETPDAWIPAQFDNPANPRAHYRTTGPEVWEAAGGETGSIGAFVAGVGTGGTISGAGRYLKEQDAAVLAIAVEPAESAIITQKIAGETLTPGPHLIQGIGANFIPSVLDLDVLDGVEQVERRRGHRHRSATRRRGGPARRHLERRECRRRTAARRTAGDGRQARS